MPPSICCPLQNSELRFCVSACPLVSCHPTWSPTRARNSKPLQPADRPRAGGVPQGSAEETGWWDRRYDSFSQLRSANSSICSYASIIVLTNSRHLSICKLLTRFIPLEQRDCVVFLCSMWPKVYPLGMWQKGFPPLLLQEHQSGHDVERWSLAHPLWMRLRSGSVKLFTSKLGETIVRLFLCIG